MKLIRDIIIYTIFSAAVYYGSWISLHHDYQKVQIENVADLVIRGGRKIKAKGMILSAIQELEEKKPLFLLYWPIALQRAVEVRMTIREWDKK